MSRPPRAATPCKDCGVPTARVTAKHRESVCLECAIKRNGRSVREISQRAGPLWERRVFGYVDRVYRDIGTIDVLSRVDESPFDS